MRRCKGGRHELVEIVRMKDGGDSVGVVRWCRHCGAVVVDQEFDGHTRPGGVIPMMYPVIALAGVTPTPVLGG
jgi:hypothetical protein